MQHRPRRRLMPILGSTLRPARITSLWRRVEHEIRRSHWPAHPFDAHHGIETSKAVPFWRRRSGDAFLDRESVGYAGSQPSIVRHVLGIVDGLPDATFLDIGCGKGRAVAVATEFPFRRIVGLEMLKPLCAAARRNAATLRRRYPGRTAIEIVQGDATTLAPSAYGRTVVLFLYNSFGRGVFALMLQAIEADMAQHPDTKVVLIYDNPVQADLVDASPRFTRVFADLCTISDADMAGSVYGNTEEPVVVFQNAAAPHLPARPGADRAVDVTLPKFMSTIRP